MGIGRSEGGGGVGGGARGRYSGKYIMMMTAYTVMSCGANKAINDAT